MTKAEFISLIQSRGATITPRGDVNSINFVNSTLQSMRIAMLPQFLIDLYNDTFGIILGSGYIFGPIEIERGLKYPIPSIVDINKEMIGIKNLSGKLIFGRNDLFLFATDTLGNCFMLDNLTLRVLRKYDDPFRAMLDCLIVGKI